MLTWRRRLDSPFFLNISLYIFGVRDVFYTNSFTSFNNKALDCETQSKFAQCIIGLQECLQNPTISREVHLYTYPLVFLKLVCSLYMARDDGKKWSMGEFELVWACLQLPYIVVIFSTWIVLWKEAIWEWLSLPTNVESGPIWAKVRFNPYNLTRQKLGFAISRQFSPKSHMPTHHFALWDLLCIELGL